MSDIDRLLPENFPDDWAESYGQDDYGVWQGVFVGDLEVRFRWIPAGDFQMGSMQNSDEQPIHQVTFDHGFWLAETTATQALWFEVMGDNPSRFNESLDLPVERVSWSNCQVMIKRLNGLKPELLARLPSESEWEYACRAGTTTAFSWGDAISAEQANFDGNHPVGGGAKGEYREKTMRVGRFKPNAWGLYQMHGNVWEWCEDRWHNNYNQAPIDGQAWVDGSSERRVCRGGSWLNSGEPLRSAYRSDWRDAHARHGFRLARGPMYSGLIILDRLSGIYYQHLKRDYP